MRNDDLTESQKKVLSFLDDKIELNEDVISTHFIKSINQLKNKNAGIVAYYARIMISEILSVLKEKDETGTYINTLMSQLHQGSIRDVEGTSNRLNKKVPESYKNKMKNSKNSNKN